MPCDVEASPYRMVEADSLSEYEIAAQKIAKDPYSATNYYARALIYQTLDYPDLAVGDSYKALLLVDEISDEHGEYHTEARTAFEKSGQDIIDLRERVYKLLIRSLLKCKCFRSAYTFAKQWERLAKEPDTVELAPLDVIKRYREAVGDLDNVSVPDLNDLPDNTLVRRELYPWNKHEPDRISDAHVSSLNRQLEKAAAQCEVRVTKYPILRGGTGSITQLGLFAKKHIHPGEAVLKERSLLAANNNLYDTLCDACSSELPGLGEDTSLFSCSECDDIVFCSQVCLDTAIETYHPAVCGKDVDPVGRKTNANEISNVLYFLLLARAIAMAETQVAHPLQLKEISSLWGDFTAIPLDQSNAKLSLPFSFKYNVLYPIHILTKMDLDIYETTPRYDFWIINTLYAKFRGVASGKPNRRTGKLEVCAVHPLWSLANHSCAPNVGWDWTGDMSLVSRKSEEVIRWGPCRGDEKKWYGGIRQGEEILNHYCDIYLDVKERREWAQGPLGGDCICERCLWESEHFVEDVGKLSTKE